MGVTPRLGLSQHVDAEDARDALAVRLTADHVILDAAILPTTTDTLQNKTLASPVITGTVSGDGVGTGAGKLAAGNHNHDAAYSAIGHSHSMPHTHPQSESHTSPDTDVGPTSLHHTLGTGANQAAPGNHSHGGGGSPVHAIDDTAIHTGTVEAAQASEKLLQGFLGAGVFTYAYASGKLDTITCSAAGPMAGYQLKYNYTGELLTSIQLKSSAGGTVVATITYTYSGNDIATETHS